MSFEQPTWVEVHGSPRRAFYARALATGLASSFGAGYPAHGILLDVGALRQATSRDGEPENPSTSFTLDNRAGQAAGVLELPPLGARVLIKGRRLTVTGYADVTLFEGVVTDIAINAGTAVYSVQA